MVKLPRAEASSRLTPLFEALAIEWLKNSSRQAAGRTDGAEPGGIQGIMKRAVEGGL